MEPITCPQCGANNPPESSTCVLCGSSLLDGASSPLVAQGLVQEAPPEEAVHHLDLPSQMVANPRRALEKYPQETSLRGLKTLGIAAIFIIAYPIASWIVDAIYKNRVSLIALAFRGLAFFAVLLSLIALVMGVRLFISGMLAPKRKSPQDTVQTFLGSLADQLFERAYNCLTDTAQHAGAIRFPKNDDLQKTMPDIQFQTLEGFKAFWLRIKFTWVPQWKEMKITNLGSQAAKIVIPVKASRLVKSGRKDETVHEVFYWQFFALEKDGYWFLANGFIWPTKDRYVDI
jgi:hypothetical protein